MPTVPTVAVAAGNESHLSSCGRVTVAELDWSKPEHYAHLTPPTFDFVLAADCIYHETLLRQLYRVVLAVTNARSTGVHGGRGQWGAGPPGWQLSGGGVFCVLCLGNTTGFGCWGDWCLFVQVCVWCGSAFACVCVTLLLHHGRSQGACTVSGHSRGPCAYGASIHVTVLFLQHSQFAHSYAAIACLHSVTRHMKHMPALLLHPHALCPQDHLLALLHAATWPCCKDNVDMQHAVCCRRLPCLLTAQ